MNRKLPPVLALAALLAVVMSAVVSPSAVDAHVVDVRPRGSAVVGVMALQEDPPPVQEERCAVSEADLAIDDEEQAAIEAINSQRSAAGLAAVTVSPRLMRPATWKARSMADGAPHEHDDPFRTASERLVECGVSPEGVLEILVAGGAVVTGASAVQVWLDDPPHREVVFNPEVRTIGVGRGDDGRGTYFWCMLFGPEEATVP
ncbi:MAG: CAP domain-containing protein [Dehalococcoidia bacterium]